MAARDDKTWLFSYRNFQDALMFSLDCAIFMSQPKMGKLIVLEHRCPEEREKQQINQKKMTLCIPGTTRCTL
eukprot:6926177-Ditylum_brightwellii.AAC.1